MAPIRITVSERQLSVGFAVFGLLAIGFGSLGWTIMAQWSGLIAVILLGLRIYLVIYDLENS